MDFAFTLPDRQVRYSHGVLTFDNNDNVSELSPPVGRFINLNHKNITKRFLFLNPKISLSFDRWYSIFISFSIKIQHYLYQTIHIKLWTLTKL